MQSVLAEVDHTIANALSDIQRNGRRGVDLISLAGGAWKREARARTAPAICRNTRSSLEATQMLAISSAPGSDADEVFDAFRHAHIHFDAHATRVEIPQGMRMRYPGQPRNYRAEPLSS